MNYFYHPFGEKGINATEYLQDGDKNIILLKGNENDKVFPMLKGKVTAINNNSITIETEDSGYTQKTDNKVKIIYGNIAVSSSLSLNDEVSLDTILGDLKIVEGIVDPLLSIQFKSNGQDIIFDAQSRSMVEKYSELSQNTLKIYNSNEFAKANSSYIRLLFGTRPVKTWIASNVSSSDLVNQALAEIAYDIEHPDEATGYSDDGLGAERANRYQAAVGQGINFPFCATFVSYCADKCGMIEKQQFPTNDGRLIVGCADMINNFSAMGKKFISISEGYIPKAGDLVFFDWSNSDPYIDHVGIVYDYNNGNVITLEGNTYPFPSQVEELVETHFQGTIVGETLARIKTESGLSYTGYAAKKINSSQLNGAFPRMHNIQNGEIQGYISIE